MFQRVSLLQRDCNAMGTELQSFISLSTNIIGSYDVATNTMLGGDEDKFIQAVKLPDEVNTLFAMGRNTTWVKQSHQLLRTTFLVLASMARGRMECNQLLRERLHVAAPDKIPRNQLFLSPDIKEVIRGQPGGPATQLVHWGHHAPETAKWMLAMKDWGLMAQAELMALPDECMPGVMELFHADSARSVREPQLLCLGAWPYDAVQQALAREYVGKWFALTQTTAMYLAPRSPAYFPFPCDANTLLLTNEPWNRAVDALRGYFSNRELRPGRVLPDSQIELVYVNSETGEVGRFPDRRSSDGPTLVRLTVHDGSRAVNVIPSTVETTADLVVRVRWLRFARRLRDFESLARVPIPSALRILA
jgi:hypothetical protein